MRFQRHRFRSDLHAGGTQRIGGLQLMTAEYGKQAARPSPDHVDEEIEVPLRKRCECGGKAIYDETLSQYQETSFAKRSCAVLTWRSDFVPAAGGGCNPLFAAGPLRFLLSLVSGKWCGLSLPPPQCFFEFLPQALAFGQCPF
jgi:hypothetical protein